MHFLRHEKNKDIFIVVSLLLVLLLGVGAYLFNTGVFDSLTKSSEERSLDALAREIVEKCEDAPYRPSCYEDEVPKYTSEVSSEKLFDVIRLIRQYDPEYLFCHVLAHDLGAYEVALDPDNWLNAIAKGPTDGLCSNGFAHGAIVTRFNDGKLSPEAFEYALEDLNIACETREGWNPTELIKAICYHGIGHVLVHMTEADIPVSLEACEEVAIKDDGRNYQQVCVEGVYMQLYQPLEPEDYALIDQLPMPPTRDNIEEFCAINSSNDTEYGACWREAWPLFQDELYDREGVLNYCGALRNEDDKEKCFVTAFTINGRHHLGKPDEMAALCNSLPNEYKGMCFARGANAFPEENQDLIPEAIDMCERANTADAQDECFTFLAQVASFNFHVGSAPFEEMCTSLPPAYEMTCRE